MPRSFPPQRPRRADDHGRAGRPLGGARLESIEGADGGSGAAWRDRPGKTRLWTMLRRGHLTLLQVDGEAAEPEWWGAHCGTGAEVSVAARG